MGIFENLSPELTDEHKARRRLGIKVQRDWLEQLVVKYGLIISSAIRSEMVTSNCSYETACMRFIQECDRWTANMHYTDIGTEQLIAQGDLEKAD